MILVDANLLIYAEDDLSPHHKAARAWWDAQLSGTEPVCFAWAVLNAFIRISTNSRVSRQPLTLAEAVVRVQSWFGQPCVKIIHPTEQHWMIFQEMLRAGAVTGNLVTDAHLATLAVEHNCVLYSTDRDFARFHSLKWKNPLEGK